MARALQALEQSKLKKFLQENIYLVAGASSISLLYSLLVKHREEGKQNASTEAVKKLTFDKDGHIVRSSLSAHLGALMGSCPDQLFCWNSYRTITHFTKGGWGDVDLASKYMFDIRSSPTPTLDVQWETDWQTLSISGSLAAEAKAKQITVLYRDGYFDCPAIARSKRSEQPFESLLPESSRVGHFRFIIPSSALCLGEELPRRDTPVSVVTTASGMEGYEWRQANLSLPLAVLRGVGTVLLENPFYGKRRCPTATGVPAGYVNSVADLLTLGMTTMDEVCGLLVWLHAQGFHILGTAGASMGALTSTAAAAMSTIECTNAAFLPAHSVNAIWCFSTFRDVINFKVLAKDKDLPHEDDAFDLFDALLDPTDIRTYKPLQYSHTVKLVAAMDDAYVPAASTQLLHEYWVGSEVRWVPGGHVSGFLFYASDFVHAIADSLEAFKQARSERQHTPMPQQQQQQQQQ
eukprot:GILK01003635.1.p1 GENE.GILK01003635.1~~GILK01003635.1.p1  ORF type:complete len:463 (-),score=64.09 GILK01003635.1:28-1416(-)